MPLSMAMRCLANQWRFSFYSEQYDMWFDAEAMMPVIESLALNSAELNTKTNVDVEKDDESSYTLEMMTKTKVREESDDTDLKSCILSGLLTKTEVAQEEDDNSMSPYDL
ncbi:hypothetical protein [Idiomarina piscisalsi]|nr:hypothetical protein [Idiomarina piscisalsi]